MNSGNYITTKEVAQRLNKSISTIYRYVNEKKLQPVYEDKWQIDSSLLFREGDVDLLMNEQQTKPGYTTGEVATKLSKHPSTIAMYIKTGKLKTEKKEYKGRILNFISEQELDRLKKEIIKNENEYLNIYDKQHNVYLYQSFRDHNGNRARIMNLGDSGFAELENGSRVSAERLNELGFLPLYQLKPQKYVTKKGNVHFHFEKNSNLVSNHLNIIETLILCMGEKNVKIRKEESGLAVFVKPGLLTINQKAYPSLDVLKSHLISGNITQRHDGILIQTNYTQILSQVQKEIKQELKYRAHTNKMTLDDYIESILIKHLNESVE